MRRKLGEILLEHGAVTAEGLRLALEQQNAGDPARLGDLLLSNHQVTALQLARALSVQSGLPLVQLEQVSPTVAALVPMTLQREHCLVPFREDGPKLAVHVAVADPTTHDVLAELEFQVGRRLKISIAARDEIEAVHAALQGDVVEAAIVEDEPGEAAPAPAPSGSYSPTVEMPAISESGKAAAPARGGSSGAARSSQARSSPSLPPVVAAGSRLSPAQGTPATARSRPKTKPGLPPVVVKAEPEEWAIRPVSAAIPKAASTQGLDPFSLMPTEEVGGSRSPATLAPPPIEPLAAAGAASPPSRIAIEPAPLPLSPPAAPRVRRRPDPASAAGGLAQNGGAGHSGSSEASGRISLAEAGVDPTPAPLRLMFPSVEPSSARALLERTRIDRPDPALLEQLKKIDAAGRPADPFASGPAIHAGPSSSTSAGVEAVITASVDVPLASPPRPSTSPRPATTVSAQLKGAPLPTPSPRRPGTPARPRTKVSTNPGAPPAAVDRITEERAAAEKAAAERAAEERAAAERAAAERAAAERAAAERAAEERAAAERAAEERAAAERAAAERAAEERAAAERAAEERAAAERAAEEKAAAERAAEERAAAERAAAERAAEERAAEERAAAERAAAEERAALSLASPPDAGAVGELPAWMSEDAPSPAAASALAIALSSPHAVERLVRLLIRRGLLSEEELLDELRKP